MLALRPDSGGGKDYGVGDSTSVSGGNKVQIWLREVDPPEWDWLLSADFPKLQVLRADLKVLCSDNALLCPAPVLKYLKVRLTQRDRTEPDYLLDLWETMGRVHDSNVWFVLPGLLELEFENE